MIYDRESFVAYLEDTLIPDLVASGQMATATDFKVASIFLDDPTTTQLDIEEVQQELEDES